MRLFRSVLALALASNLVSANSDGDDDSITNEVATFTGTCSEKSCTNILGTFDPNESSSCDTDAYVLTMTGATMQVLVKSTNPDFDVSNVTVKFGSRDWNTAYGATKICDPDDLSTASACQAKCTAGTVDDDGWTTCVIDGFGGKDTFDALPYYSYTEEGAQGLENCPDDNVDVCPRLYITGESSSFPGSDDVPANKDYGFELKAVVSFAEQCKQKECAQKTFFTRSQFSCNAKGCTIQLPYKYSDSGFDPKKCDILSAVLNVDVKGEYGASVDDGKILIELADSTDLDGETTPVNASDVTCVNDGTCRTAYDSCLANYDLIEKVPDFTIQPKNDVLLVVDLVTDCTEKDANCAIFTAKSNLSYTYSCDCAPTSSPTTAAPTPKPSEKPTPKPTAKPSSKPTRAPFPAPTPHPTPSCHNQDDRWFTQLGFNKNGQFGLNLKDQFADVNRSCVLNFAKIYTAIDKVSTSPEEINTVKVAIAPQDQSFAEQVMTAGTDECSAETLASGKPCFAYCGDFSDKSPDHDGDDTWPTVFATYETSQGISYMSCNEFYDVDVTKYFEYGDADLNSCADPSTANDNEKCATIGTYFFSDSYVGQDGGATVPFQAQQEVLMDVTCNCIPTTGMVSMGRSMECEKVGDCPANFIFPASTDGFDVEVPYVKGKCDTTALNLDVSSRAWRDSVPIIKAYGLGDEPTDLTADEICAGNIDAWKLGGKYPDNCPKDDASDIDKCLTGADLLSIVDPESDTLLQLDVTQSNCANSEIWATIEWSYQCRDEFGDDDVQVVEFKNSYKAPMNDNQNAVPVRQTVKMHLRHG